jgi:hypothetical protein
MSIENYPSPFPIGEYVEACEYEFTIQSGEEIKTFSDKEEWNKAITKFQETSLQFAEEKPGLCSSVYEDYAFVESL